MSPSQNIADEYENKVLGLNSPRVLIGNEASKNGILIRIDTQAPLQTASIIPPEHPDEEEGVASETVLTSGTLLIQIGVHAVPPGGLQTTALQDNASEIPVVSTGASPTPLPAPNDDQVQTRTQDETPTGQALRNENGPYSGKLTNLIGDEELAAFIRTMREKKLGMFPSKMTESSLLITTQVIVPSLIAWLGNGNYTLSHNTKILRDFAVVSTIVGYISSFSSILMCKLSTRLAVRILNTFAYAGAAFGFLATMGMLLPDEHKLWITFLACAVCFPALVAGFCTI